MQFDWWTFALEAVNFLILVWILHRFLYRPVLKMIARRREATEKAFEEAADARRQAEEQEAGYEEELAKIGQRREAVLREAHRQASVERDRMLKAARVEAEEIVAKGREQLAGEREAALAEAQDKAADLAIELAEQLLRGSGSRSVAEASLERIDAELSAMSANRRDSLRRQLSNGAGLRVVTAPALDRKAQATWRERLAAHFDPAPRIDFETDESLVGGAELRFPSSVLSFAWRDALAAAREALDETGHADA